MCFAVSSQTERDLIHTIKFEGDVRHRKLRCVVFRFGICYNSWNRSWPIWFEGFQFFLDELALCPASLVLWEGTHVFTSIKLDFSFPCCSLVKSPTPPMLMIVVNAFALCPTRQKSHWSIYFEVGIVVHLWSDTLIPHVCSTILILNVQHCAMTCRQ